MYQIQQDKSPLFTCWEIPTGPNSAHSSASLESPFATEDDDPRVVTEFGVGEFPASVQGRVRQFAIFHHNVFGPARITQSALKIDFGSFFATTLTTCGISEGASIENRCPLSALHPSQEWVTGRGDTPQSEV